MIGLDSVTPLLGEGQTICDIDMGRLLVWFMPIG
jgi:hypothetical protein